MKVPKKKAYTHLNMRKTEALWSSDTSKLIGTVSDTYHAPIPVRYVSGEYPIIKLNLKKTIVWYLSDTSNIHEGYGGGKPIRTRYLIFLLFFFSYFFLERKRGKKRILVLTQITLK
jgi:hypothetical protein